MLVFCRISRTVLDPRLSPQIFINCCRLTPFAHFYFCVSYFALRLFFPVQTLSRPLCLRAQPCSKVATIFCSSWDECPTNLWTLPTFSEHSNMARNILATPAAAAATAQVKLCPYDEEEPHIWFHLIEAQFAAAGIRSQKLKYANALASLPKQVLRDTLDTLDACNGSEEPFDQLKNTLLGQFGKSKWQSYFELLCLPMEMQGLKPSILVGKLKQHLPPGASPDNDLFLAAVSPSTAFNFCCGKKVTYGCTV